MDNVTYLEKTTNLSKTNLYIKGLPPGFTDEDLINMCRGYGQMKKSKVIIDPVYNCCKGYGFVDFESQVSAITASNDLLTKGIQVQFAKEQDFDQTNLYISNLPILIKEEDLENMLSPFGPVISTKILRFPNGLSKKIGFARLESNQACMKIIKTFNGKLLPGHIEPLVVKFADGGVNKRRDSSIE